MTGRTLPYSFPDDPQVVVLSARCRFPTAFESADTLRGDGSPNQADAEVGAESFAASGALPRASSRTSCIQLVSLADDADLDHVHPKNWGAGGEEFVGTRVLSVEQWRRYQWEEALACQRERAEQAGPAGQ